MSVGAAALAADVIVLLQLVVVVVVFLLVAVAFLELFPLLLFFDENGAFWNTIAKPPGDGCSSAPCTARQRRNIVRPMINFKIATKFQPATTARSLAYFSTFWWFVELFFSFSFFLERTLFNRWIYCVFFCQKIYFFAFSSNKRFKIEFFN